MLKKKKKGKPYLQHSTDADGNDIGGIYIGGKIYTEDDFIKIGANWIAKKVSLNTYNKPDEITYSSYYTMCQDYTNGETKRIVMHIESVSESIINVLKQAESSIIATDENGTASAYWLGSIYSYNNNYYYKYVNTEGTVMRAQVAYSTSSSYIFPCRWCFQNPFFFSD